MDVDDGSTTDGSSGAPTSSCGEDVCLRQLQRRGRPAELPASRASRRGVRRRAQAPPAPPVLQPLAGWPAEVDAAVGATKSALTPHHIPPHPTTNQILLFAGVVAGS